MGLRIVDGVVMFEYKYNKEDSTDQVEDQNKRRK